MTITFVIFLSFCIGIVSGLRSLTGPAISAWAAHRGWLNLTGTAVNFMSSTVTLVILVVLAVGELITDKLPSTPARTRPAGLIARIVGGGLSGACLGVTIGLSTITGALFGAAGGIGGALAGYEWRTGLVRALQVPDYAMALLEDTIAIAAGIYIVSRF